MSVLEKITDELKSHPKKWLVTGCAGFIGSNLIEFLLNANQKVIGLDNFSTGLSKNLDDVQESVGSNWENFQFIDGCISDLEVCMKAVEGVDYILHQAALGSIPRSIDNPLNSHHSNVTGFVNMLWACKEKNVKRIVYASSSSVYGDEPNLPKVEERVGKVLSPYAATKKMNEIYQDAFGVTYGLEILGIRYFNVFGKRQNPDGAYAAVIPKWVKSFIKNETVSINGDGETSRDFCYVKNVIQMNVLCALTKNEEAYGKVFNCAFGERTTLNKLFELLKNGLSSKSQHIEGMEAHYRDFRKGDVRHSLADISLAKNLLGYEPSHSIEDGLKETLDWYSENI